MEGKKSETDCGVKRNGEKLGRKTHLNRNNGGKKKKRNKCRTSGGKVRKIK